MTLWNLLGRSWLDQSAKVYKSVDGGSLTQWACAASLTSAFFKYKKRLVWNTYKKENMEKHLKLAGLMKRNGDRRDSNLQAIQRRKKAGEGGILKISFRAVTCTMSAAAAGKLILSRDPERFWRISANPVPHPHCRQLYICTPPHSHTQIIEN